MTWSGWLVASILAGVAMILNAVADRFCGGSESDVADAEKAERAAQEPKA